MTLKMLSYNICEGGRDRLGLIAEVIRGQSPDVVAITEAANYANPQSLARELDMKFAFGEANNPAAHIVWMSRLPIRHIENHRHPSLAKTLLEIEVRVDSLDISLFATHLGSRWDVPQPIDEVPFILNLLRPAVGRPHLLAGDFNALRAGDPVGLPPDGERKRGDAVDGAPRLVLRPLIEAGYVDCFRRLHSPDPGFTYPSSHPWLRLDYIFASPELARNLVACDVVQHPDVVRASDHLPICAEFQLGSPGF